MYRRLRAGLKSSLCVLCAHHQPFVALGGSSIQMAWARLSRQVNSLTVRIFSDLLRACRQFGVRSIVGFWVAYIAWSDKSISRGLNVDFLYRLYILYRTYDLRYKLSSYKLLKDHVTVS